LLVLVLLGGVSDAGVTSEYRRRVEATVEADVLRASQRGTTPRSRYATVPVLWCWMIEFGFFP
jgi:hypothetical protein